METSGGLGAVILRLASTATLTWTMSPTDPIEAFPF